MGKKNEGSFRYVFPRFLHEISEFSCFYPDLRRPYVILSPPVVLQTKMAATVRYLRATSRKRPGTRPEQIAQQFIQVLYEFSFISCTVTTCES